MSTPRLQQSRRLALPSGSRVGLATSDGPGLLTGLVLARSLAEAGAGVVLEAAARAMEAAARRAEELARNRQLHGAGAAALGPRGMGGEGGRSARGPFLRPSIASLSYFTSGYLFVTLAYVKLNPLLSY